MFTRDPLDANVYAFDPFEEDQPTYLDEDAEPSLEELVEPEEIAGQSCAGGVRQALGGGVFPEAARRYVPALGSDESGPAHVFTRTR